MKLGMTEKYLKKRSDFAYLRYLSVRKNFPMTDSDRERYPVLLTRMSLTS